MENCVKYYVWSDCERICHLKAALHGTAAQLLWQLADDATEGQIVDILRRLYAILVNKSAIGLNSTLDVDVKATGPCVRYSPSYVFELSW